jgi:hypothetical protein
VPKTTTCGCRSSARDAGSPSELPTDCDVLILRNAAALTGEEQDRLLEWLERPGRRAQVVSTTPRALHPLIASRLFDDRLYYYLNTMLLPLA